MKHVFLRADHGRSDGLKAEEILRGADVAHDYLPSHNYVEPVNIVRGYAATRPTCPFVMKPFARQDDPRSTLLLTVAVLIAVFVSCSSGGDSEPEDYNSTPVPISVRRGDEAVLSWDTPGGSGPFWLAANEEAFDQMTDASVARDVVGMSQLVAQGRIFPVSLGTRVLVLDPGFFKTQVRVMEGEAFGRTGWAPREFVIRP